MYKIFIIILSLLLPQQLLAKNINIDIKVDVSEQKMYVSENNKPIYEWDVSTARQGKVTPRGQFSPKFLSKNHKSSLYNNAPMPFSIFYYGNFAIHGTLDIDKLGRPASAGCVRLHPDNAEILFNMVQNTSFDKIRILVQD